MYPVGPHPLPSSALVVVAVMLGFYLLPSFVALVRGVRGVVRLNVYAGWTGIGWLVALLRACRPVPARGSVQPWR